MLYFNGPFDYFIIFTENWPWQLINGMGYLLPEWNCGVYGSTWGIYFKINGWTKSLLTLGMRDKNDHTWGGSIFQF